ncbi:MAG TPA: hypothetical protein VIH61_06515 [Waddliaceae bacterium]
MFSVDTTTPAGSSSQSMERTKENTCFSTVAIVAIATILLLAGLFVSLASNQILPHGTNSISHLGQAGAVAGSILLALGTIILMVAITRVIRCLCKCPSRSHSRSFSDLMPEVREAMRYPKFIVLEPCVRRQRIASMTEEEFDAFCHYLFEDPMGIGLVEVSDAILGDLQVYPNWDTVLRSKGATDAWINAINKAALSTRDI